MDSPEQRLLADLDRLAGRLNSEEGIPVFLVCENLAPDESGKEAGDAALTSLNQHLALAFRRDADVWRRRHPEAAGMDAAKIVEVLADRDFADGGAETSL